MQTMLSAFRHSACRSLPQCLPRYARPLSTETTAGEKEEAWDILRASQQPEIEEAPTVPQVDLATMHHYIPPPSSPLLQFMTTLLMRHGEYAKAAKTVSRMLLHIYSMTRSPPMPIVEKAVEIVSPAVRNRKMKQGGGKMSYMPQALNERQRTSRGLKHIIFEAGKARTGKTYAERMARQIIGIVNDQKGTNTVKEEVHRLAMVNRGILPKR